MNLESETQSRRKAEDFSEPESFGLFMEALRALQSYADYSSSEEPEGAKLDENLDDARALLETCCRDFPNDLLPRFYLAITVTMQNQKLYAKQVADPQFNVKRLLLPESDLPWPFLDRAALLFKEVTTCDNHELSEAAKFNLAHVYAKRDHGEDLSDALELLRALSPPPTGPEIPPFAAHAWEWMRGRRASQEEARRRKYWEAIALPFQACTLRTSIEARIALKENKRPEFEKAIKELLETRVNIEQSKKLSPEQQQDLLADSWTKLGFLACLRAIGEEEKPDLEEAKGYLECALRYKPHWIPAQTYLAIVYKGQDRPGEALSTLKSVLGKEAAKAPSSLTTGRPETIFWPWARNGSYPSRPGNEIQIFIDGQAAYREIADAFHRAKKFIYATISFGNQDFLPVPENGETMFEIFRSRQKDGVDVRLVIWQPARLTPDTIPDPAPVTILGVNSGPGSIQARWDVAKGYQGWYRSPHDHFKPVPLDFPTSLGCHHQKTYIMDDGAGGVVAFVGGINPVQAYWDTTKHDLLDVRRVARGKDLIKGLEDVPPLHDVFYEIKGPAAGDVLANFVERYNGASIRYADVTTNVVAPITADQIPQVPNGIELQVLRTIAPKTYPATQDGDRSIRELYFNALSAAGEGDLIYIENQYFFDHGIISEIHEAAERGAKIIAILTWKPDEGTSVGEVEGVLERIANYQEESRLVAGHRNVALLTLGNSRPDPRTTGKTIYSETYIHSKTLAVFGRDWAVMTGGSANIAFTSMWFHSEMNVAFTDRARIKSWVAQLWAEHLNVPVDKAMELIAKPDDAFNFFKQQATSNKVALDKGLTPEGRVYYREGTNFPPRKLEGISVVPVSSRGI